MRPSHRLVAGLVLGLTLTTGGVVAAAPAIAADPCLTSPEPPDDCFSGPPAPAAPTYLTATSVLQTSVTLTWQNNAGTKPYHVARTANGSTTTFDLAGGSTSFTDTTAPAGTSVRYAVYATACNVYDCTDGAAATKTVATKPKPANPVGSLTVKPYQYATWQGWTTVWKTDPYRYVVSGWTIDWDTTGPLQVVVLEDGVVKASGTAQANAGTNSSHPGYGDYHGYSFTLPKASAKGSHQVCVQALNVGGGADAVIGCGTYDTYGAPTAATDVTAMSNGSFVTVGFTDRADDETGFYLQRSTDSGATWLQVGSQYGAVPGTGTRKSVDDYSTVIPGTCYRILMTNVYGQTPSAAGCTS